MIQIKIKKLKVGVVNGEYTKWETFKWLCKRFLRVVVPQIPAVMSYFQTVFPGKWLPYLVAVGGLLTVTDKLLRDVGAYSSMNPARLVKKK